ncbi:PRAME family member 25-like [Suncus etruscus]|uniref:PRAME family member 25-like n=1 Tax=Suncus etruscus TaxID=109475 RepID=UPI00210F8C63|nr:PRAME family member 25-like [Suncus etruscus]
MTLQAYFLNKEKIGSCDPPSLLHQAMRSLLRDKEGTIAALRDIPPELYPQLFLEAYGCKHKDIMKAMDILDGIDILLYEKIHPRCKLEVLDLRYKIQKFWTQWCDIDASSVDSSRFNRVVNDESSKRRHQSAALEVVLDLWLIDGEMDKMSAITVNWASGRNNIHLCVHKIYFIDMPIQGNDLRFIQLDCIQELEVTLITKEITCAMFSPFLGQMRSMQKLILTVLGPEHINPQNVEDQEQLVTQLSSQLLGLHRLRELYLHCIVFLKGQLNKVLRNPLPELLESCASTLQELDLGVCGLQDIHLKAILPGLKLCSQLRVLNLHGNSVSRATLFQVIHHLAGLPHLMLEVYPAPLESLNSLNMLDQSTFDLICSELMEVLKDLGSPRCILVGYDLCLRCGKIVFQRGKPTLKLVCCFSAQIKKILFKNLEEKGITNFVS